MFPGTESGRSSAHSTRTEGIGHSLAIAGRRAQGDAHASLSFEETPTAPCANREDGAHP